MQVGVAKPKELTAEDAEVFAEGTQRRAVFSESSAQTSATSAVTLFPVKLIQIVDLQTNRAGARAFDTVEYAHHIRIRDRARRFDEDDPFDARVFRQVATIAKLISIGMISESLLE